MPEPFDALARRARRQAAWCAELGSPLYASLLDTVADDLETGGPVRDVLAGFDEEPGTAAVALRLMAAVHRLVLDGTLPELARHYPSTGGDGDAAAAWPAFRRALSDHPGRVRDLVASGCQTNEVGRSAALLGGFLEVARETSMPLRILEIGASAGLNLRWDRYRYESGESAWGDAASPVVFDHAFDVAPPLGRRAEVAERRGCDLHPIDPCTDDGALTLRSFVWADQVARMALLEGALRVAREVPAEVEREDAVSFLDDELRAPFAGVATVVYHSVFIQYVAETERHRIADAIESAKARATKDSPLYHLAMEPGVGSFEVRLDGRLLATTQAHGTGVRWLVDSRSQ